VINIPEGRRALPPDVRWPAPTAILAAVPATGEIDILRSRNELLAKTLTEILGHFEERRQRWEARVDVSEATFSRWKHALEAGAMRHVPELLGQIVQEQAKHVFATLTTCACGYAPIDNSDWSAHRAAMAVEVIAAWIEKRTSPRIDEQGPEPKLASTWAAESIREGLRRVD
jgi:hypothetical protein